LLLDLRPTGTYSRPEAMESAYYHTIAQITESIRTGNVSPVEITETHLQRAAALQPALNAFVHLDTEGARKQAEAAAASVRVGEPLGRLHGVPITVKSSIDVAGWPCPAGSLLRKDYVPRQDAPLVARLKAAGAILLGNTNTPEFLMAYETNNLLTGKTSNPWDLARSAGGSSGGEAAAIAAGCSAGGVGSDGGGSVRVPAHFCGICGLKPTPGRIPATGHFPPGVGAFSWIGVVGPMARTIADVRVLFEVMAGPDIGDALSAPVAARNLPRDGFGGMRVGILISDALGKTTLETRRAVGQAAKLLGETGFVVEPLALAGLDRVLDLWWFFFGFAIGHLLRQRVTGREDAISPMLREYLALTVADAPITIDQFMNACADRDLVRAKILDQMSEVPILLAPVSSGPAFDHGEGTWKLGAGYRDTMRHSQWLNLTGLPGATVPLSFSAEGLPIGVQVIGRPYEEELVLGVAECIEQARGPWRAPENDTL
jgi:amidase